MATDYATLLKNYGWNNILAGLDAGRFTDEHHDGYSQFNIPGIGMVSRDPNGTILFQDPESRAAYAATGNAPVYNYIGSPEGWSQYQVSHGGMSAENLAMLAAAAITAGTASGALGGAGAAGTSGASGALGTVASGAGGYAIPTAEELAAAGFDVGGMGLTGAGGIGSAGSVVSAGAGAAGYGSAAAGLGGSALASGAGSGAGSGASGGGLVSGATSAGGGTDAALGIPDYANESAKLLTQTAAPGGSLLSTSLPTANTMSFLDDIPSWLTDAAQSKAGSAILGGLLGGMNGTKQTGTQTITTQQTIDPRMASILYGPNGNDGFLSKITGLLGTPQDSSLAQFGNQSNAWLGANGLPTLTGIQGAANSLMNGSYSAPTMSGAQVGPVGSMQAATVNAPSQNGTDLAPAYQKMIYGNPAENPYLTGAIEKGINQSNNAFGNMLTDATRTLTENVLPSIRSGAIVNGAMGSSRQGVAEGKALNDYSTQVGRAISQYGQNNTDTAVGAQAGAFSQGQDRALSAMTGLSGNQYGTAIQDASNRQQANQVNYTGDLQKAMQDAQFQQQAAANNQQSQLSTNQLNTNRTVAGIDANNTVLGNAYTYGTNQDTYGLNKTGKISGLLSPYTGLGGTTTQSQPIYQNTTANMLGGGLLGANIYNLLNKSGNS